MSATLDRISPSRASRSGTIENLHVDCLRDSQKGDYCTQWGGKQEKSVCPSKYKFLLFSFFENIGYFIITFFLLLSMREDTGVTAVNLRRDPNTPCWLNLYLSKST